MIAGSPDEDGFFTVRVLTAACGVGALSLVMYLLVLRYIRSTRDELDEG